MPPETAVATVPSAPPSLRKPPAEALKQLEQVVLQGNLKALSENERIGYYARVCESLGLNPLTRPFEYIELQGKLTLYARKDATDQLRQIHGVNIVGLERERSDDLQIVTATVRDRYGREDSAIGAVSIAGLKGEALANALMKAETKAKRRATLSIVGLGWMDEVEALDQRAIEVAPRAEASSLIRARTAALTGGTIDPGESEGASVAAQAVPASQPDEVASHAASSGGSPAAEPEEPKAAAKPRTRRRASAPKARGDEGYWRARAHAVAEERGLDSDAVKRIAGDVLGKTGDWSRTELSDEEWEGVTSAILEAPVPVDENEVSTFAAVNAIAAGVASSGDSDPWPAIDKAASDLMGSPADEITTAEWLELGLRWRARAIRTAAGA